MATSLLESGEKAIIAAVHVPLRAGQREQLQPGLHVPERRRAAAGPGPDEVLAVGREVSRPAVQARVAEHAPLGLALLQLERPQLLAGGDVPAEDLAVIPAGNEGLAVRGELKGRDCGRVAPLR